MSPERRPAAERGSENGTRPVREDDLLGLPVDVAPRLLGAVLTVALAREEVSVRVTEVEAYHGLGTGPVADPGSHARSGPTARNRTMWGPAGHLYVYLSHGIHACANVVCGPDGVAGGVLLRAGEVVAGADVVRRRAGRDVPHRDLARGPGRLGRALGLRPERHDGLGFLGGLPTGGASAGLRLAREPVEPVASGPRVGVAGVAGTDAFPWRFWIPGDRTVSAFRWGRGAVESRSQAGGATTHPDSPG